MECMASSLGIVSRTLQFLDHISCEDTPKKVDALSQHSCLVPRPRELVCDHPNQVFSVGIAYD